MLHLLASNYWNDEIMHLNVKQQKIKIKKEEDETKFKILIAFMWIEHLRNVKNSDRKKLTWKKKKKIARVVL